MTYKTRQELLRAAADWIDVCEKAGVVASVKVGNEIWRLSTVQLNSSPDMYEFPLALLDSKEVWVGSELYTECGSKIRATKLDSATAISKCSWNPPNPKTVMVEMLVEDVQHWNGYCGVINSHLPSVRLYEACKKALESMR